jgi:hypothetical protein
MDRFSILKDQSEADEPLLCDWLRISSSARSGLALTPSINKRNRTRHEAQGPRALSMAPLIAKIRTMGAGAAYKGLRAGEADFRNIGTKEETDEGPYRWRRIWRSGRGRVSHPQRRCAGQDIAIYEADERLGGLMNASAPSF